MSDKDRIEEIRARHDAATPGPWFLHDHYEDAYQFDGMSVVADGETVVGPEDRGNRDLELIANAPADIAWLLDRDRRLTGALRALLDATKWDGPALSTKEVVALLADFGFTLGEFGQRW